MGLDWCCGQAFGQTLHSRHADWVCRLRWCSENSVSIQDRNTGLCSDVGMQRVASVRQRSEACCFY
jgi:hypothetical protein